MKASIVQDSAETGTMVIADLTSGQRVTKTLSFSGPQTSAECAEEAAPSSATGQQLTLADFNTAQFTNLAVGGTNLSSGVRFPVDVVDGDGNIIASPGAISNDAFTVDYQGAAPRSAPTPAPAKTGSANGYRLVGSDGGIFTFVSRSSTARRCPSGPTVKSPTNDESHA